MTHPPGAARRRSPFADACALLGEAGLAAPSTWLCAALFSERPPRPIVVAGAASELVVRGVIAALLRDGSDVLIAPAKWLRGIDSLPTSLPRIVGVLAGYDELADHVVAELGSRCALLVGGFACSVPPGARLLLEDLDRERIDDLELHAALGWP